MFAGDLLGVVKDLLLFSTWVPCHLKDCESWMTSEMLLIQRCPIMWLLLSLCRLRAKVDQCDAGLIHVLHQAIVFPCIMCLMGMLNLLAYSNSSPLPLTNVREVEMMMCDTHSSVRATDCGIFAAAADADIIDFIVQVWQQSQLFCGCLAASLCTLQA